MALTLRIRHRFSAVRSHAGGAHDVPGAFRMRKMSNVGRADGTKQLLVRFASRRQSGRVGRVGETAGRDRCRAERRTARLPRSGMPDARGRCVPRRAARPVRRAASNTIIWLCSFPNSTRVWPNTSRISRGRTGSLAAIKCLLFMPPPLPGLIFIIARPVVKKALKAR